GRSPQIVMCASSTPSSRRRSAIQGPFASWTRPVRTSVPVTTMPARALTGMSLRIDCGTHLGDQEPMIESELLQADVSKLDVDTISNAAERAFRTAVRD